MKALDTYYAGYHFRSRTEARWALFFDTLQIPYRYEAEGYDLDGVRYLPDFWLPGLDGWVEIKGEPPREADQEKARRLALRSGKEVYTLVGDVWLPPRYQVSRYVPPRVYAYPQGKARDQQARIVAISPEVSGVLQQVLESNAELSVKHGYITLQTWHTSPTQDLGTEAYLRSLQQHAHSIAELAPLLQRYSEDLLAALTPETGWQRTFSGQTCQTGFAWAECSACGQIVLSVKSGEVADEEACIHQQCQSHQPGRYAPDTPRLRAAYQAARQARFST